MYHAETKHDESEKKKKKGDVTLRNPYKRRQMDSVWKVLLKQIQIKLSKYVNNNEG